MKVRGALLKRGGLTDTFHWNRPLICSHHKFKVLSMQRNPINSDMYVIIKLRFVWHQWHHACVNKCHGALLIYSTQRMAFLNNPSVKAWERGNSHKSQGGCKILCFHVRYRRKTPLGFLLRCFLMRWCWHALLPAVARSHVVFGYAGALQRELQQSCAADSAKQTFPISAFPGRIITTTGHTLIWVIGMNEHDNTSIIRTLEGKLSTDIED